MYNKINEVILKSEKIAIINHQNPDGDAFGSAYALKLALLSIGKKAEVFLRDGDNLLNEYSYVIKGSIANFNIADCDLKIAVDSSDEKRILDFKDVFSGNTIAIDHHISHIPYAKYTLVECNARATGEIIYKLIKFMKINITKEIAHNLYVAISCDTGNFKYSSTTAETHLIAAELMKTGIDVGNISKMIFDTKTMEYLKLLGKAINRIKLFCDGKIAILSLDESDFNNAGIKESDASAIVVIPGQIKGVEAGAYIRKRDNEIKVSLRTDSLVNAAEIASEFGGGGHIKAAGFSLNCSTLIEAEKLTKEALEKALNKTRKDN